MKQNERVLSSQALNQGRSLGQGLNVSVQTWRNFTFDSSVRKYHVCKDVWKPEIGKNLHAEEELDDAVDKFAMKVVKNNETVGHLPGEYS